MRKKRPGLQKKKTSRVEIKKPKKQGGFRCDSEVTGQ